MLALAKLVILSACSAFVAAAGSHDAPRRRHPGTNYLSDHQTHSLSKRFDNARMTFYATGLGACGSYNKDADYIVALNSGQYGSGGHCYEKITITYGGKTVSAQIVDECPGCPYGGLDLSPGLFSYLSSPDAGVIYGSWDYGDAPEPSPTPTPEPKPKPTPKPSPTPTPSPTSEKIITSLSSASSSLTSSSSSATPSSSSIAPSSSSASSASASPSPAPVGNLDAFNGAFLQMVFVAAAAAEAH